MKNNRLNFISFFLILLLSFVSAQLRTDFYRTSCPNVESLVRAGVEKTFNKSYVTAPGTLRLFFHDCFVRGCDASILIASPAERDHPDDVSLAEEGFDAVVMAKQIVDSDPNCRDKVSCADILALAAREVVVLTGGPSYPVELGRRDGLLSTAASAQHSLPEPDFNLDSLNAMFARHGLSQSDMIALSGAHTLGIAGCEKFSNRIYNFTPAFREAFVSGMTKLGRVGVITGTEGEIRRDCTRVN